MTLNNPSLFNSLSVEYDAWFEEDGKIIFALEAKAIQEVFPTLFRPWLEVGVGSGRFAQVLGIETGLDPSVKLLEIAKKRGIRTVLAKGEEQPFNKGTFATVFLIVTLCFVDSPVAVLREVHRILKPEGRAVLGLVLRESPWGQYYQSKKLEGHRFYRYATFYSYEDVSNFLADSGFNVEKVVSTLFQKPGNVEEIEIPVNFYSAHAGFSVIVAKKINV